MLFERTKAAPDHPVPDLESQARFHRNRMAGMWAAELLGLIGHAAQDYARELAHPRDLPEGEGEGGGGAAADEERLVGRLARDLRGKVGRHEIRQKLGHLLHEARRQLSERRRH